MFRILLIFILLGSFVGWLSLLNGAMLYSYLAGSNGNNSLPDLFMVILVGYPFSLVFGCVPATCAGLWYSLLLKHRTVVNYAPGKRLLTGLAIGFQVSVLFVPVIGILFLMPVPVPVRSMDSLPWLTRVGEGIMRAIELYLPMYALPGALAAAVCCWCVSDRMYARLTGRQTPLPTATEETDPQSHGQ